MSNNQRPLFDSDQRIPGAAPRGTPQLDPFGNNRGDPFDPVMPGSADEFRAQQTQFENPSPILFPRNYFAPEGARSLNLFSYVDVPAGQTLEIFHFRCPIGMTVAILGYSIYHNYSSPVPVHEFIPTVDNKRVLEYHGAPDANGICCIGSGTHSADGIGVDFKCQIFLEPGQVLAWNFFNGGGSSVHAGARFYGYIDAGQRLTGAKFGD